MEQKRFLRLENLSAYIKASQLAEQVWDATKDWDYFAKDTMGKQFVKSADSIAANVAEGFGRFSKKEKVQFYRYSYGSILETINWNEKAHQRKLLTHEQYQQNAYLLSELPREVHQLIKFTIQKLTI